MKEIGTKSRLAVVLSTICLIISVGMFFITCSLYWPQVGDRIRAVMIGQADSPLNAAFSSLSEGLEQGKPVREVFAQTIGEILP